jgi:hypothetical protein
LRQILRGVLFVQFADYRNIGRKAVSMESIEDLKVSGQVPAGDSVGDLLSTPLSSRTSEMDASRHSHIKHGHEKGPGGDTLEAPTKHCPVHPHYLPTELEGLAWIAGKWSVHEPGKGRYPTIKDFTYAERIEFSYSGQKMLDYKHVIFSLWFCTRFLESSPIFLPQS